MKCCTERLQGELANISWLLLILSIGGSLRTTNWQVFQTTPGLLTVVQHVLTIGGYNNEKSYNNEVTDVLIDDVRVETPAISPGMAFTNTSTGDVTSRSVML
jgi:hypothetical protein